jgi:hypothetical protein
MRGIRHYQDYRIGMVLPGKGSPAPAKAPLTTRRARLLAENERREPWRMAHRDDPPPSDVAERRARVEAEIQRMLAEQKTPK